MNATHALFAANLASHMDIECSATQKAVDALVSEFRNDRAHALEVLRSEAFRACDFNSALLSWWKERDILRATGKSRDHWLKLAEVMKR